jgi:hypothetical protein
MTTLDGTTVVLTYDSGLRVRGKYGPDTLEWEALEGPDRGATGTERTYVREIGPGTYFVSWLEASGTTVSQVLDLPAGSVLSFITYEDEGERMALLDAGSVELIDLPDSSPLR